jgi:dipeptidyl aminopeptidase/acylaminoacyl peptidase
MKKTAFILVLFALQTAILFSQPLTVSEIMAEPSVAGMRVESERLSPDGKTVVFLWNAEGKMPLDLYLVSTSGGVPRKILSPPDLQNLRPQTERENKLDYGVIVRDEFVKARENQIGNIAFSPDSKKLLLAQNGDLFVLNITEREMKPRRLTRTQAGEGAAQWLDNERILFSQGGNFFVVNIENFLLVQISKEANPQNQISVSGANPSENKEFIAYTVSDGSKQKSIIVPTFIDELVQAPSSRRGFTEQKVLVAKADGSLEKSIEIELPKAEADSYLTGVEWLADNKTLIIDRVDKTHKRRQIFVAPIEKEKASVFLVHEETDEKWIGGPARILEANPKNADQLFFGSERDGWHHLYFVNLDRTKFADKKANADAKQITSGNWEIGWAEWTADGKQIIYSSTQETYTGREFFAGEMSPQQGTFAFSKIPSASRGMKTGAQIDKTASSPVLLYEASEWNKPGELYAVEICPRCQKTPVPRKLTNTTPEIFLKRKWNAPQFVEINSRDNKKIPAKIYLPENFNKSKKYPMVVFVHGAGYLQNIINGWNNYYREFMFNQLLTQKGYVVLDIDYRGSAGLGRDWRTDVYDFLGGKDGDDHIDSIDYMVANYAVDPKRVGVYGGSYGGFIAGMLVMREPEKIAAAAALRPVFDWKNYYAANPFYTSQRLRSPRENPEGYRRSSPISYAEQLRKPLLILHGLVDSNVQAQDSFQLVEKLIRLNKTEYFESAFYPSENHAFARPTSWEDEYKRILVFFEKHLK